jgi:hypothetical protein
MNQRMKNKGYMKEIKQNLFCIPLTETFSVDGKGYTWVITETFSVDREYQLREVYFLDILWEMKEINIDF